MRRKAIRPPFAYYGGKTGLAKWILSRVPPHHTFVDLFGGSGAIILAKEPSPVEVYNDIDEGVTNFYSVLRDPQMAKELVRLLELTPYSRKEYYNCLQTWKTCDDPVEKARRWFYVQATSFNGRFGAGMRTSAKATSRGKSALISAYQTNVERIYEVAKRFRDVIIENLDFSEVVKRYDTPETVFYADPPYVLETRNNASTYVYEIGIEEHKKLVDLALNSKGVWVISGYDHPVYAPLVENGWAREERGVVSQAAAYNPARTRKRIEVIWYNRRPPSGTGGHKTVTQG